MSPAHLFPTIVMELNVVVMDNQQCDVYCRHIYVVVNNILNALPGRHNNEFYIALIWSKGFRTF